MADTIMVPRHTITTGDVFIPEVWTNEVLLAREKKLVMSRLVDRYDADVADGGDTLNIPQVANLTAYAKAASTSVTLQAPTETDVNMSINRHFESSILIEDRLKVQSKRAYNILQKYSEKAGYAVGLQMDTDLTGLYSGLSQSVGDGSTALADSAILAAVMYLDNADAPEMDRHFVIRPNAKADVLALDKFTLYQNVNAIDPIRKGAIGDLYGCDVWVTTAIQIEAATPTVVHNLMFHREAFALAVQMQPRVQFQYKQEYLGTLTTVDSLWGYVEQRDDHAVDVRSSE